MLYDGSRRYGSTFTQRAVILGDPGSGKSTLLQCIALAWAERSLSELPLYPIPLLIELRTYARDKQERKCEDILSFLHSGSITCRLNQRQLHDKLKAGQAVALFDGIDEVFEPALRHEVVTDIHRFTNEYRDVQVIVTSRWLDYKAQRLRDAGFRHFMLQDLEKEQIEEFIQRWHNETLAEGADKVRKQERLQKAIWESKAIRELAGNPLLLTMMAILNRNQELPRDRPQLYNRASEVLLHQWDVERTLVEDHRLDPKTIDYRDKQAMLRKVTYFMQSSEKGLAGNIISETDLKNILIDYLKTIYPNQPEIIARLMINQLRIRNSTLCSLGGNSYAFVHRTFLEYFCAWEFVDQFEKQRTLDSEQLIQATFGEHWQDETWHEVLRLIAGMINAKFVAEAIDFLLKQEVNRENFLDEANQQKKEGLSNLLLAAECFSEVRNKSAICSITTQLLNRLQREVEQGYSYQLHLEIPVALTTHIATIGRENPTTLPWLKNYLKEADWFVAESVVQTIAQVWKDDPETLPWLKALAQQDKDDFVRQAAVRELAEGWKDDPETLPILRTRAQSDKSNLVRQVAVQELAKGWKDLAGMFEFLRDRAIHDPFNYEDSWDDNPRQSALRRFLKITLPSKGLDQDVPFWQVRMSLQSAFNVPHRHFSQRNSGRIRFIVQLHNRMNPFPGHTLRPS
nr:HEAT repeat domain-containing protein [Leptolyngbya ohadii]